MNQIKVIRRADKKKKDFVTKTGTATYISSGPKVMAECSVHLYLQCSYLVPTHLVQTHFVTIYC